MDGLIGKKIRIIKTRESGFIVDIKAGLITVFINGNFKKFKYPDAQLLYKLVDRLSEMDAYKTPISAEIACEGKNHIKRFSSIVKGQNQAIDKATSEKITFIWGLPEQVKQKLLRKYLLIEPKK